MLKIILILLYLYGLLNAQEKNIQEKISFSQSEWEPLVFIKNENASGMIIDYLTLLEKKTNLKFDYIYDNDWSSVVTKFQRGQINCLPGLISADVSSNDKISKPFFKFKLVLAGLNKIDYINNLKQIEQQKLTVAIGADSSVQSYLKQNYPNIKTYIVNTTLEGLSAVETHKSDLFLEMAPIVGYGIELSGSKNLKIVGILQDEFELVMGIKDEKLLNIINSGIEKISQKEVDDIYKKYIKIDIKEKIDYKIIAYIIGIALFILLGFIMWLVILKNEIKRRKVAELEALQANKKLLEMTEELKIAIAKADSANQAKSQFLANMSHEIRTPMNTIVGMTDLVLRMGLNQKQKEFILKVSDASYHLLQIINDILDYSKIEVGKIQLELISFNMNKLIESTSELIILKNKKVEFLIDISQNAQKKYFGDPLRIKQVLINLLSNAVKFTYNGTILLKIDAIPLNNGYDKISFKVHDTGIGIKSKYIDDLFNPFSQADMSTTRNFGGTGLGLSISQRLVKLMDGVIKCESEYEKGSIFSFELILRIDNSNEIVKYELPKSLKVLVVDDNENALSIFTQILTSFGMESLVFNSSEKAIKALEMGLVADIALLDWQIDEMNGVELMKIIKDRFNQQINSILMVTAYDKEEVLNALENEDSGQAILVKPISSSSLFDAIINACGDKHIVHDLTEKEDKQINSLSFQGLRALIVEDNNFNQEIATEILNNEKIITYIVNNGEEAIEWLTSNEEILDFILMDCQMPIMDGYKATKIIRNKLNLDIPIIAMTANALDGDKEKCFACGMNGYISKPFHIDDFLKEIARCTLKSNFIKSSAVKKDIKLVIDGFDVENALIKLNNNEKLYIKLLEKFVTEQKDFINIYDDFLQNKSLEDAKRMAHTLKGVAGTLGINNLVLLTKDLEKSLSDKKILLEIKEALNDAFVKINNVLNSVIENKKVLVPNDNKEELELQIDYLIELLKNADAKALTYGKFLTNQEGFSEIYKLIENFDFDEAIKLLLGIKRK